MKKWTIITICISIIIVSIICGFIIHSCINFSNTKQQNQAVLANDNNKEEILDTSFTSETVSPNAKITIIETFSKCGHTSTITEIVPREIVNLNQEKVHEYYKDCNIDKFSSNEITISRTNKGICQEHYILRESDGYISINCKNDIGEYIFKGLTDISVQYLPEEDLNDLLKGIEIVGRDNLNKFLEDFE